MKNSKMDLVSTFSSPGPYPTCTPSKPLPTLHTSLSWLPTRKSFSLWGVSWCKPSKSSQVRFNGQNIVAHFITLFFINQLFSHVICFFLQHVDLVRYIWFSFSYLTFFYFPYTHAFIKITVITCDWKYFISNMCSKMFCQVARYPVSKWLRHFSGQ